MSPGLASIRRGCVRCFLLCLCAQVGGSERLPGAEQRHFSLTSRQTGRGVCLELQTASTRKLQQKLRRAKLKKQRQTGRASVCALSCYGLGRLACSLLLAAQALLSRRHVAGAWVAVGGPLTAVVSVCVFPHRSGKGSVLCFPYFPFLTRRDGVWGHGFPVRIAADKGKKRDRPRQRRGRRGKRQETASVRGLWGRVTCRPQSRVCLGPEAARLTADTL